MEDPKTVVAQADKVLRNNLYVLHLNGVEYRRTVPSKEFYVHQWNWDSATVAMGLVHVDPFRARDELLALIAGQHDSGLIAHITYNPNQSTYYPQAEKWHTEQFRQGEIISSGITQPPVLAIAVEYVLRHAPQDQDSASFMSAMLPALMKYHDHLKRYRDPENCGLLTIIHPWESGTDNSPRWDSSLEYIDLNQIPQSVKDDVDANRTDDKLGDVSHRPTKDDYYRYMGLVHKYAGLGWDYDRIIAESPFAVKDILFTSIWSRANEALANILRQAGESETAAQYDAWASHTRQAIAGTWSDEHSQYCDVDVAQGRWQPIVEPTNAMFAPLYCGAVTDEQLPVLLKRLADPEQFWTAYPVPTTALDSPKFELARYWRGPTWPITNLFIAEGLARYSSASADAKRMADELYDASLRMIAKDGFYEYFDPTNGAARPGREDNATSFGFGGFSWPAAIYIKMYYDRIHE